MNVLWCENRQLFIQSNCDKTQKQRNSDSETHFIFQPLKNFCYFKTFQMFEKCEHFIVNITSKEKNQSKNENRLLFH